METDVIYCGDCKEVLNFEIPSESVDFVYLDPPFFTNKNYEIIWKDGAEIRAFNDRWKGGINHYINWMEERLGGCRDVLNETGSLSLHCDYRASHYLRVSLDRLFGRDHFEDEIIWHYTGGGRSNKHLPRKHHHIFRYRKGKEATFNADEIREPYSETSGYAKGGIVSSAGKKYMPNPKGKIMDDVWEIPIINPLSSERVGYPTQKPLALLDRIVRTFSNKGEVVLDPFCGCGTTLEAAAINERRWVGIDVSSIACDVMKQRMERLDSIVNVEIKGLPVSIDDLKSYDAFKFQDYACKRLGGKSSERKSGDMGIDGYVQGSGIPIQVKQSERVGRNIVDNFETAVRRRRKKEGVVVAFSFTKSAYEEVARVENEEGLKIKLVTVKELLSQ
ncbi:MAG: DNA methyltransferase [Nanoarchaeota archaeon]